VSHHEGFGDAADAIVGGVGRREFVLVGDWDANVAVPLGGSNSAGGGCGIADGLAIYWARDVAGLGAGAGRGLVERLG
jgi:hypothetical protein